MPFRRLFPLLLAALLISPLRAQIQNAYAGPLPSGEHLVFDVNVVDVFFTVTQRGKFVANLRPDEFILLENNRPESIRYFSEDSQAPLSLAVMIDTSDSEALELSREVKVATEFFQKVLAPGDKALVVTFDSFIDMRQDFTEERDSLVRAVTGSASDVEQHTTVLETNPTPKFRSTALYDAVSAVTSRRFKDRPGRKAMIIITDGMDQNSRTTRKQAIEAALRAETTCYVLLVVNSLVRGDPTYAGERNMQELVQQTGGRLFLVDQKLKVLPAALSQIATELRHQYSIGYTPHDANMCGEFRHIVVKARRGLNVRARRGYYAIKLPLPGAPEPVIQACR